MSQNKPTPSYPVLKTILGLILLTTLGARASAENCTHIDVVDDRCTNASVKANLDQCEDGLISVQSVKCKGDQMKVFLRGKFSDYRVVLETNKDAWGKAEWKVKSEAELEHRTATKTLPKTEHERTEPPVATVEIPTVNSPASEPKVASAFLFSGFLDGYYEYNFNHPRPVGTNPVAQNNLRGYDWHANQFDLSLAEFTIKHVRKETSFVMDLDFGSFAELNAQSSILNASGGPTQGAVNEATKHIGQAVLTYTPASAPAWVFEVGKMPTHLGLELTKSKDNWNYSRSALFSYGIPLWHTGFHAGYTPIANQLSVSGYIYNGWNTVYDNNFVPSYGLQLKWTPNDKVTWIYNYLGGPEQASNNINWKQVHEANVSYTLTPTVSIVSDFLYGKEAGATADAKTAFWYASEFGAKWQTSPKFYLSPRFEIYRDPQGYTLGGVGQSLYTYTLTESCLVSEGLEVRFEERIDHSTLNSRFTTVNGVSANQPTLIMGILYSM